MKRRLYSIPAFIIALVFLATACVPNSVEKSVVIASKQFAENILLSEMYAQLIERLTDIKVVRKQSMGATVVCYTAMKNGEVDIYVEYTGTIYKEILKSGYDPTKSQDELLAGIKNEMRDANDITVFGSIGPNNTYALAMRRDKARALGIETMSDLRASAPKLVFSANDLYFTRDNDGYDTMVEKYGMRFKSVAKMSNSLGYDAVGNDQVDVMIVYTTDSLLLKYDMVILKDDKQMFPEYYAVPMIRSGTLEKYPELEGVMGMLEGLIDNRRMQELNYKVDVENNQPKEVANAFLKEVGLL